MTLVLDGKKLAKAVRAEVKASIAMALARGVRPPGLAVILVGEDPASQTYVASKEKLAKKLGFHTWCDAVSYDFKISCLEVGMRSLATWVTAWA